MDMTERRQVMRESLDILADVRIDGIPGAQRIGLRNVSAGGLMADGLVHSRRGQLVWIDLRGLGWVEGTIAWVQGNRCGVAFHKAMDPAEFRRLLPDVESRARLPLPLLQQPEIAELPRI